MGFRKKKEEPVPLATPINVCEPDPHIPEHLAAIQDRVTRMGDHLADVNGSLVDGIEREIDVRDRLASVEAKLADVRNGQDAICVMIGDVAKLVLEAVERPVNVNIRVPVGLKLVRVK